MTKTLIAKKKAEEIPYFAKIEDELKAQGVLLMDTDNLNIDREYLVLPKNLTDITTRDLGEMLNAFTQQKIFQRTVMGRLELVIESAERRYYNASALMYEEYSKSKMSEKAKERLINQDPEVKKAHEFLNDKVNQLNMVSKSIANIEDAIFLLSREVTRRNSDFENENRSVNVRKNAGTR